MAAVQLAPVNPPLGVFPAYYAPNQTTLVMKEKVWSLSGDAFHIVDEHGREVVQCRGQTFSLSDRKEFADASGKPLFSLRNKLLSIHKSFYGETADGTQLFAVKGKFSIGTSKMIATFTNASDQAPIELLVKGDWLDRSATITMGNVVVAQISRSYFNMREIFGGQQTYYVICAPGVDLALMAAICVCLDEKENEKK
ncbi:tubby C-terminal-like domain-containing protein [Amylocarpus encephaloides]|uniref:Tubby C-terminal-like domain-containing protein n=1 Tax=Amylocarpus encephaloides TaxID=45428 RepID=A0A9P7YEG7_9HELO|nr:tubby C-terminal-like domain-containing protein [Amylocarpus encephaloides]